MDGPAITESSRPLAGWFDLCGLAGWWAHPHTDGLHGHLADQAAGLGLVGTNVGLWHLRAGTTVAAAQITIELE